MTDVDTEYPEGCPDCGNDTLQFVDRHDDTVFCTNSRCGWRE